MSCAFFLLLVSVVSLPCAAASATDAIVIDEHNARDYEGLFPDPVFQRLQRGEYRFTLVPVDPVRFRANYTQRFWKASQGNAGKYAIDEETGGLKEVATGRIPRHLFGLPFPQIDPNDPSAGSKIVHNYHARAFQGDGNIHIFDLADVELDGDLIRRVKVFLSYRYYFGSTSPLADALPDNTAWRQLAAALEPQDVEGVGFLTWRFHDWTTWDHVWAYMPNVRRVRRVRASTRGDRIPGFEVQGDDADCYDGKATYFRWKLLRSAEVIGPVGTNTPYAQELKPESPTRWSMEFPYNSAVYETPGARGAGWLTLTNVFIRRPVWIVEGTPRDPYYPVGRIVLYVDRDLYHAYYKIGFTPAGEQYQTNFCGSAWGRTNDDSFGGPSALLMIGVNEKENRGTPTGRFTRETFERAFQEDWFTPEHLSRLSVEGLRE